MSKLSNKKMFIIAFALGLLAYFAIQVIVELTRDGETVHEPTIQFISSSEANSKINEHQGAFILDVRSNEEYFEIRIPGAINIPYLMIGAKQDLLPGDKQTLIFVYCRTGRRATTAANKLLELGYTNIVVFPGMASWQYETVTG